MIWKVKTLLFTSGDPSKACTNAVLKIKVVGYCRQPVDMLGFLQIHLIPPLCSSVVANFFRRVCHISKGQCYKCAGIDDSCLSFMTAHNVWTNMINCYLLANSCVQVLASLKLLCKSHEEWWCSSCGCSLAKAMKSCCCTDPQVPIFFTNVAAAGSTEFHWHNKNTFKVLRMSVPKGALITAAFFMLAHVLPWASFWAL